MNRTMMNTLIRRGFGLGLAGLALIWLALAATVAHAAEEPVRASAAESLVEGFGHPPAAAKPHVYWVSMGDPSREGVTADWEAMKSVGIGGGELMFMPGGCMAAAPEHKWVKDWS
jgi:hypothetical protein